jgi:SAM-dependent methyltransferase
VVPDLSGSGRLTRAGEARPTCRICGGDSTPFLDLGQRALANAFFPPEGAVADEARFPLEALFCATCGLVHLGWVVPPELMFRDYLYVSSTSATMRAHFREYAHEVLAGIEVSAPLVVEVASNDGCLLRNYLDRDVRILGVEPARNLARLARGAGVPTVEEFFCAELALRLREEHGPAQAVVANNVLAHVDDVIDFVRGLATLLAPEGVVCLEVPHLATLVTGLAFDTIYHEHLSYFSLRTVGELLARAGLALVDVQRVPVHGGSLRIYARHAQHAGSPSEAVEEVLAQERALGLDRLETFQAFGAEVGRVRRDLRALLAGLVAEGKRVAGFGASAKGNTLLSSCGIDATLVEWISDRNELKQGLLTPGTHIPVVAPEVFAERAPDVVLLLAWNFSHEFVAERAEWIQAGGRYVLPLPRPQLLP